MGTLFQKRGLKIWQPRQSLTHTKNIEVGLVPINVMHNLSLQTKRLSFHYRVETAFPIETTLSEQIPASEFCFCPGGKAGCVPGG